MTDHIEFRDEEFSFHHNGVAYFVHTEVGKGLADVVVKEIAQDDVDQEPSDD